MWDTMTCVIGWVISKELLEPYQDMGVHEMQTPRGIAHRHIGKRLNEQVDLRLYGAVGVVARLRTFLNACCRVTRVVIISLPMLTAQVCPCGVSRATEQVKRNHRPPGRAMEDFARLKNS